MPTKGIEADKNPLAFLDRLLQRPDPAEDERDSNLHFGDVRFWRHLEFIDQAQIYRTKSLEYRTLKLMFCEAIFYAIFLAVLTFFITMMASTDVYESRRQQLNFWGDCIQSGTYDRDDATCMVQDVRGTDQIMDWLRDSLVPKTFADLEKNPSVALSNSIYRLHETTEQWEPRYVGDTETLVLLGAVRVRQLRVQYNQDCQFLTGLYAVDADPNAEGVDCFGPFSDASSSKLPWKPTMTPEHLHFHYDWSPYNVTQQTSMPGYHGDYGGDGFVFPISLNLTGARGRIAELKSWEWLDHRTRAVIVEMSTVNPNVNVIVHNRILFELPASGGTQVTQEAFAFRVFQLSLSLMQGDEFSIFICCVGASGMHMLLLVYVIFLIFQNGVRYFTYFWSICDLIILTLFFVQVIVHMVIYSKVSVEPNLQPEVIADPEMFAPIGNVVKDLELSTNLLAIHGLFCWLKILKYFNLSATFQPFVRVVERSITNLCLFSALLFIVLFGFAVAFHIGYGGQADLFATIRGSFVACVIMPGGGVSLEPILAQDDLLGPVLIFSYIILVGLLCLKVFMAIVIDCYTVASFEIHEVRRHAHSKSLFKVFLWTYFNALKGTKLVGKETEDEKGDEDEQTIPLSSLPEAIALRHLNTRRNMQALLDSAEKEMTEKDTAAKLEAGYAINNHPLLLKLGTSKPGRALALEDESLVEAFVESFFVGLFRGEIPDLDDLELVEHIQVVAEYLLFHMDNPPLDIKNWVNSVSFAKFLIAMMPHKSANSHEVPPENACRQVFAKIVDRLPEDVLAFYRSEDYSYFCQGIMNCLLQHFPDLDKICHMTLGSSGNYDPGAPLALTNQAHMGPLESFFQSLKNNGIEPCWASMLPPEQAPSSVEGEYGEYVIELHREGGAHMMGLDFSTHTLIVHHIQGGLIKKWNQEYPLIEVKEGDEMIEVNGVRGNMTKMLCRLLERVPLTIRFHREDTKGVVVNRVQLQRMLDEDAELRDICGAERAIDVVRKFRVDASGVDPYDAVQKLQASVADKLQELEEHGMRLSFDEMETLKQVSQELHGALTESQKEWRGELLSVMQMASLLSKALIDLTRKMEQVQLNHNNLAMRCQGRSASG